MRAVASANVRTLLKAHTADVHQRLETVPAMQRLLSGKLGIEDYAKLLQAYRKFYVAAAPHLALGYRQLRAVGFTLPEKNPLGLLDADLAALACMPMNDDAAPGSNASAAPSVGWVWVAEGSVLGGVVIDRALHGLFGEQREGRRFFEPQPDMSLRWQNVCTVIETYGHDEDRCAAMVQGAQAAFHCVEHCLLGLPQ